MDRHDLQRPERPGQINVEVLIHRKNRKKNTMGKCYASLLFHMTANYRQFAER